MSLSGNGHKTAVHFSKPPERVVSLVPSLTESLFDLGFGSSVVGLTDYCVHPVVGLEHIPRLGGTKNPRVDEILGLQPDLVLANQEENTPAVIKALESAGIKVWVTFPKSVRQYLDILWILVGIYQSRLAAARLETLEIALDWAESALAERKIWSYFCPIWRQAGEDAGNPSKVPPWWMTFNRDTYSDDLLRLMGGKNIFADRIRRYPLMADLSFMIPEEPGDRDTRYPHVTDDEISSRNPDVILLPDEPFPFNQTEAQHIRNLFANAPAVQKDRIFLLDGSLITWCGTRLGRALQELPVLVDIN